jgi:hypothetical protein
MSDARHKVCQVFHFSKDEKDIWPSAQFTADLQAAHSPFLIMLVGNGRSGKSTRANQLLLHELQSDEPFEADNGVEPITMKFQYVGPLKFRELSRIHRI